jgi:DNA-binding transcriptional regulator LsrR (DeoR family)
MYYHENMRLSEIAACLGLTESQIFQFYAQALALLRNYLLRVFGLRRVAAVTEPHRADRIKTILGRNSAEAYRPIFLDHRRSVL